MVDESLSFMARLKQHHIYRVVAGYAVCAWIVMQAATRVFPYFGWSVAVPILIIALILGFPVVLVLAWVFIKPKDPAKAGWQQRHWKWGAALSALVVVLVVVSGFYAWRFSAHHAQLLAAVAANQQATVPAVASSAPPVSATMIPAKSVAVLPFVNESGEKSEQYFSDGLSEDLITTLSQFAGLKVINRDSSFQFRNSTDNVQTIGEKLGVAHLLEGSVQRAGDVVRISAELVNVSDGSTVWSQRYDRPYKDLFALQDNITKAVADALQAKLLTAPGAVVQSDRPPSGNLAAYDAYLRGTSDMSLSTETGMREAIAQFDQAIRLDPHYALAYAAMSAAWQSLAATFDVQMAAVRRDTAQARAAADMALQLNPDLAAAHVALSSLMESFDFNWTGALAESQRAVELAPDDPIAKAGLAAIQARLGHLTLAVEIARQVLVRTPLSAGGYFGLGRELIGLGQLDEAETALRKSIQLAPGASRPYAYLTIIEVIRGDTAAALSVAQKTPVGFWHDFAVALALQIGTERAAADTALKGLIDRDSGNAAYQIAEVYAVRKDPDNMFKWLDRSWSNDDAGIELLLFDPLILHYRNDPRFAAFCKKVGLPNTTDAVAMP